MARISKTLLLLSTAFALVILVALQKWHGRNDDKALQVRRCIPLGEQENRTIGQRLVMRRDILRAICKKHFPQEGQTDLEVTYVKNRFLKAALFFSDKYKILFCQIPKCATRSQAKFLAVLDGLVPLGSMERLTEGRATSLIEKHLSARKADSLNDVVSKIRDYKKLIIVREPFSRLLSAYRNKLENNARGDSYATFARNLHKKYSNGTGEELNGAPVIALDDFISYLIEEPQSQNDQHWNFYHRLCSPCAINYEYIVTMDTIDEDMEYIKSRMGITVPFPRSYDSYTDNLKFSEYFSKANPLLVNKLYHEYELDFSLFGFPPPPQF